MNLKFEELKCVYCNSENLGCTLWYPEITAEELEDYMLTDGVNYNTDYGFSIDEEFNLLVKCRDCSRWVEINISQTEVIKKSPISLDLSYLESPILEFDPITNVPRRLYLGLFSFEVIKSIYYESEFKLGKNTGHFYPYPLGLYSLHCASVEIKNYSSSFKCQVSKHETHYIFSKNEDIDFYEFRFKWVESKSIKFLEYITKLSEKILSKTLDTSIEQFWTNSDYDIKQLTQSLEAFKEPSISKTVIERITKSAGQARNQQAYRFLNWLENETRQYVWKIYLEKYLPEKEHSKWWKSCFPAGVINNIQSSSEGERKVIRRNLSKFPLDYADFDDLMKSIEKEWDFLKAKVGTEIKVVQGHFEYIKNYRHAVAHSRLISHDDLMLLQDNAIRFAELIGMDLFINMPYPFYQNPNKFK